MIKKMSSSNRARFIQKAEMQVNVYKTGIKREIKQGRMCTKRTRNEQIFQQIDKNKGNLTKSVDFVWDFKYNVI